MPLTTNIAESSNITQQKNSSSNISLHNLTTVAIKLTIQANQCNTRNIEKLSHYFSERSPTYEKDR